MVVGEKQALDPSPQIGDIVSAWRALNEREERRGGAGAGCIERAPLRALTNDGQMGVWMLRRGRARCWETREGVEGESARTFRIDCVYSVLYVHTCEIPTLPRSAAGLAHGHPDSNRRRRACCRPLSRILLLRLGRA